MAQKTRRIVGIHACLEILRMRPETITRLIVKNKPSPRLEELMALAQKQRVSCSLQDTAKMEKIAPGHQGVIVEAAPLPGIDWMDLAQQESCLFLGLDGIEDPHNFGAILRTAWLMKVDAVFVSEHHSAPLTPAVHKVACGGVEHVPIVRISKFSDVSAKLKELGFWVYGLTGDSQQGLWSVKADPKAMLIVGSEEKGLRQTTAKQCDVGISIPQAEAEASYNASVAVAMAVGEFQRQRDVFFLAL